MRAKGDQMTDEQKAPKPKKLQQPIVVEFRPDASEPWSPIAQTPPDGLTHAGILADIRDSVEKGTAPAGDYRLIREYRRVRLAKVETVSVAMDDIGEDGADG